MAIKQSEYIIVGANGEDITYHFATDGGMVRVIDKDNNQVGTLKEFGFEGKVVESGSFKDLKISGLYRVKNLKEMPTGIALDKMCILSVEAVGQLGNPEFVSYTLITQLGEIQNCVVVSGKASPWTKGGKTLENTITNIVNSVGQTEKLITEHKATVVGAINELSKNLSGQKVDYDKHIKDYTDFKKHNHDDVYLKKNGGATTGDMKIGKGFGINFIDSGNAERNLVKGDGYDATVGSAAGKVKLVGKGQNDLTYNGYKVWTEQNDGINSGLDADKLGGTSHKNFLRSDERNEVSNDFLLKTGKSYYIDEGDNKAGGSVWWRGADGTERGHINFDSTNAFNFYQGGKRTHSIDRNGVIESFGKHHFIATESEGGIVCRLNSTDKGMGIYRNNGSKYLGFYNWEKGVRIGYIGHEDHLFHFDREIVIQNRKLYLQSATPGGSRTVGDIWIG